MKCLQHNVGGAFHVKIDEIVQYAKSSRVDIIILSETEVSLCDAVDLDDDGWKWHGETRIGRGGRGVGSLYRRDLIVRQCTTPVSDD